MVGKFVEALFSEAPFFGLILVGTLGCANIGDPFLGPTFRSFEFWWAMQGVPM